MASRSELEEQAIRAYSGTLSLLDPLRVELWDSAGLTLPQLRLVFLLAEHEGMTVTELADAFGVRAPSMTRLIDRVEQHGLLRREGDASDRRVTRLFLTADGEQLTRATETAVRLFMGRVFSRMGDDRLALLVEMLRELRSAARDVHRESELGL
jgi:DNA-binding MarR family transcriptional regulator